jgi:hypothetical protein
MSMGACTGWPEMIRRLEKLKSDQSITPEEYAKKRAEILGEL